MRRFVVWTLAAASLALCLATVALWVRSRTAGDYVGHVELNAAAGRVISRFIGLTSDGELVVLLETVTLTGGQAGSIAAAATGSDAPGWHRGRSAAVMNFDAVPAADACHVGQFRVGQATTVPFATSGVSEKLQWATAPVWAVVIGFAVWPAAVVLRFRTRRRPGHCRRCGYDLRASPDRCPECGSAGGATAGEAARFVSKTLRNDHSEPTTTTE